MTMIFATVLTLAIFHMPPAKPEYPTEVLIQVIKRRGARGV